MTKFVWNFGTTYLCQKICHMENAARCVRLFDLHGPYPAITSQRFPTKLPNARLPRRIPLRRPGWTDLPHNFRRCPCCLGTPQERAHNPHMRSALGPRQKPLHHLHIGMRLLSEGRGSAASSDPAPHAPGLSEAHGFAVWNDTVSIGELAAG